MLIPYIQTYIEAEEKNRILADLVIRLSRFSKLFDPIRPFASGVVAWSAWSQSGELSRGAACGGWWWGLVSELPYSSSNCLRTYFGKW